MISGLTLLSLENASTSKVLVEKETEEAPLFVKPLVPTSKVKPVKMVACNDIAVKHRLETSTPTVEVEEEIRTEVKITIPESLRDLLTLDLSNVENKKKLIKLPSKITVENVIDEYKKYQKLKSTGNDDIINEICEGILKYFNVMLGTQLLYETEKPQHHVIRLKHPDKKMSKIYSSFHLLRLFVKLGPVLSYSMPDKESIRVLTGNINEFLNFLEGQQKKFFKYSM